MRHANNSVFAFSLNINAAKRTMPRKKSNSINVCSAIFTNKCFIQGKKYKAVIPLTIIINARLKQSLLPDNAEHDFYQYSN